MKKALFRVEGETKEKALVVCKATADFNVHELVGVSLRALIEFVHRSGPARDVDEATKLVMMTFLDIHEMIIGGKMVAYEAKKKIDDSECCDCGSDGCDCRDSDDDECNCGICVGMREGPN